MNVVKCESTKDRVKKTRKLIQSAGNQLMGISFTKRSDGTNRKLTCRTHVFKPTYAHVPSGKKNRVDPKKHNLITVFSMNDMRYNNRNRLCGRGEWKSVPLDSINRIKVGGIIYKIVTI